MHDIKTEAEMAVEEDAAYRASFTFLGEPLRTSYAHYDVFSQMLRDRKLEGVRAALCLLFVCSNDAAELEARLHSEPEAVYSDLLGFRDAHGIAPNSKDQAEAVELAGEIFDSWQPPDDLAPAEAAADEGKKKG